MREIRDALAALELVCRHHVHELSSKVTYVRTYCELILFLDSLELSEVPEEGTQRFELIAIHRVDVNAFARQVLQAM